jgi:uncharacterized coiled-coil protein SlyX
MKNRAVWHLMLSVIVAVMLIVCATAFVTNYSSQPSDWVAAQRQPILWLVDFTALYTLMLMATLSRTQRYAFRAAEEMHTLRLEHQNQLESLIAQAADLEEKNVAQEERIEELETGIAESHSTASQAITSATNLLTEAGFRALQAQIEAQARQLEAVNLALQYHRVEISQLRHGLKALAPNGELPPMPAMPLQENLAATALAEPPVQRSLTAAAEPEEQPIATENASEPEPESLAAAEERKPLFDPTVNAPSTIVHAIADFEVIAPQTSSSESKQVETQHS